MDYNNIYSRSLAEMARVHLYVKWHSAKDVSYRKANIVLFLLKTTGDMSLRLQP